MGARTVVGSAIRGDFGGAGRRAKGDMDRLGKGIKDWWEGNAEPGPDTPEAPAGPPGLDDERVREAHRSEKLRARMGRGRRSTFLTGPDGVTGDAPVRRHSLLGG